MYLCTVTDQEIIVSKEIGFILYRGPSLLDGSPIVVVATMASSNRKTGLTGKKNMVQVWILADAVSYTHLTLPTILLV